jgi:ribosomal protein S18 acetylase RimI-like enzyme
MEDILPLRCARATDVPALVALVNSAYRGDSSRAGWTTEADLLGGQRIDAQRLTETIATPDNVVLLHEANVVLLHEAQGDPIACVHLERTGAGGYLGMLTIRPTSQGGGLGRRLLEAAERWAVTAWGVQTMDMTVIVQRTELIAWYERRGYRRTGEYQPFPYGDERFGLPRRDDLQFEVLRKSLAAAAG